MKLLLCEKCWDVFKLTQKEMRQCECGAVKGRYKDNLLAEVSSNAVSLAIGNGSLENAIYAMRFHQERTKDQAGREEYYDEENGKITYAWVRPNTGNGNPHCEIIKD